MEEELTLSFTPAQSGLIRNGITSPSTLSRASVPVFDGIFKDLDLRDRENRPVTGSKYKVSLDIYDLKSEINSLKKQLRITFIQENEVEGRNLHLYWQKTEGKPCQIATPLPRFNAPKSCLSLIRKEEKLKEINETSHQTEVGGVPSLAGMLLFSLFKLPSKEEPRFHFRIKRE
ncbi:MAG: hypothetical protein DRP74_02245 [Candidatus Omnitrophota bacterium]|nr:MAG: hypothetical protein DRP74_02245 [Candidatus Omnitrophota bacterium]